jgi:hypothetical protein
MNATIIEIKPHRWGWKVFEMASVEPVFREQQQAIDYAQGRARFRAGEIRVLDRAARLRTLFRSPIQGGRADDECQTRIDVKSDLLHSQRSD